MYSKKELRSTIVDLSMELAQERRLSAYVIKEAEGWGAPARSDAGGSTVEEILGDGPAQPAETPPGGDEGEAARLRGIIAEARGMLDAEDGELFLDAVARTAGKLETMRKGQEAVRKASEALAGAREEATRHAEDTEALRTRNVALAAEVKALRAALGASQGAEGAEPRGEGHPGGETPREGAQGASAGYGAGDNALHRYRVVRLTVPGGPQYVIWDGWHRDVVASHAAGGYQAAEAAAERLERRWRGWGGWRAPGPSGPGDGEGP